MTQTRNKVVQILMDRDDLSEDEATELFEETQAEIADAIDNGNFDLVDDILAGNLGLEPDYIMDVMYC